MDSKAVPEIARDAVRLYERAIEYDRLNKVRAYEALRFMAGDQWEPAVRLAREAAGRPCQTINRCPSFVKQVSNDIRMAQPAVRVIATGGIGDDEPNEKRREYIAKKAAELRQQLIRHVENRSDAQSMAYAKGADDQVSCGYGAWRIVTEYASDTSLEQEIRILPVDDPVGIVWDPDSRLPTREDAMFCFVPVDMTREAYQERYPGKSIADVGDPVDNFPGQWSEWCTDDVIRVCEYWYKKAEKKPFIQLQGRLIDVEDSDAEQWMAMGGVPVERETYCVYRAVISAVDVLEEPKKWIGRRIPIIPVYGEETQIGRERLRWGLIEHIKDAQRRYNYFSSAHTEIVALQPKSPFVGTQKQFEGFEDIWSKANTENYPFLPYQPDPQSPGPPQRSQPPVSSQGISDGIQLAAEEMKAITGIFDAALGQKSNETSGVAIRARQKESDVGSYVYAQNFGRAIRHTGRVLLDIIPRVYDTARTFRIMGKDGRIDAISINQPGGVDDVEAQVAALVNDITAGDYDVVLEEGPSYTTKREEAKAGMLEFVRAFPDVMQIAGDLVAKAQDWPNSDDFAKRLRAVIPPNVIEAADNEDGDPMRQLEGQPQPPPPELIAQIEQEIMSRPDFAMKAAQARKAEADAARAELELMDKQAGLVAPSMPMQPEAPPQPDPMEALKLKVMEKRAMAQVDLEAEAVRRKLERDMGATAQAGLGEEAGEPTEAGPTPVDVLASAVVRQGQMMQEGLTAMAEAMTQLAVVNSAPKRIIRDDKQRVAGVETVQ